MALFKWPVDFVLTVTNNSATPCKFPYLYLKHKNDRVLSTKRKVSDMSAATSRKIAKTASEVSTPNDSTLWPEWSDVALNNENWAAPKSNKQQNNNFPEDPSAT